VNVTTIAPQIFSNEWQVAVSVSNNVAMVFRRLLK